MGHGSIVDQLIPEVSPQRWKPGDEPRSNYSLSEQDGSITELMPRGPTSVEFKTCKGRAIAKDCCVAGVADDWDGSSNKTTDRGKVDGNGTGTQERSGRHSRHK